MKTMIRVDLTRDDVIQAVKAKAKTKTPATNVEFAHSTRGIRAVVDLARVYLSEIDVAAACEDAARERSGVRLGSAHVQLAWDGTTVVGATVELPWEPKR